MSERDNIRKTATEFLASMKKDTTLKHSLPCVFNCFIVTFSPWKPSIVTQTKAECVKMDTSLILSGLECFLCVWKMNQ